MRTLWLPPTMADIGVDQGVVTLEIAVRTSRRIDGVVGVVNELTRRGDGTDQDPSPRAPHSIAHDWPHGL